MRRESGWKLLENGEIEAFPLAGHSTAALPPLTLLRLEFFQNPQDFDARMVSELQLQMSAPQARILADALSKAADAAEAG